MHVKLSCGDWVVVPGWGVGRMTAIECMEIGGHLVDTYCIELPGQAGRYWIPTNQVQEQGLRTPMDASEVEQRLALIQRHSAPPERESWNRRHKRYRDMMRSNQPRELALFIGELVAVRAEKASRGQVLSFEERKLLRRGTDLLVQEIAVSTGSGSGAAADLVEAAIRKVVA